MPLPGPGPRAAGPPPPATEGQCAGAATVSAYEVIPGSVLIFNQGPDSLNQRLDFIRGSRGYQIDFFGPAGQTPGETLRIFAQRAAVAAR